MKQQKKDHWQPVDRSSKGLFNQFHQYAITWKPATLISGRTFCCIYSILEETQVCASDYFRLCFLTSVSLILLMLKLSHQKCIALLIKMFLIELVKRELGIKGQNKKDLRLSRLRLILVLMYCLILSKEHTDNWSKIFLQFLAKVKNSLTKKLKPL